MGLEGPGLMTYPDDVLFSEPDRAGVLDEMSLL